jgi:hypothetical protein
VTAIEPSSAYTHASLPRRYAAVVSSPLLDATISAPVLSSMKLPVPYVFFASPASKHVCPNTAACWSPRSPHTATSPPTGPPPRVRPYRSGSLDGRISGSIRRGMPSRRSISSSQSSRRRSISIVRDAFVQSVTCTPPSGPPVSHQMIQVSTLPNSSSPRSARRLAPWTLSRIQPTLGPEKYVATTRPVRSLTSGSSPSSISRRHASRVRVSCQTIALYTGLPVAFSQTTAVSRWFVIPIAVRSDAATPPLSIAPRITAWVRAQISIGSCSTQPGLGQICSCSR